METTPVTRLATTQVSSATEWEQNLADMIVLVCTPPIVVLGTMGNILSLIILVRRHFRKLSIGVYLSGLTLADTVSLWCNSLVMNWFRLVLDIDFRVSSLPMCRLYIFLLFSSRCCSAWFLVSVTVERLFIINFPLHATMKVMRQRAWAVVFSITVLTASIFLALTFLFSIRHGNKRFHCGFYPKYKQQHYDIAFMVINLFLPILVPGLMLVVTNILLILAVTHYQKQRAMLSVKLEGGMRRTTIMLLILSGFFLLLNLPLAIYKLLLAIHHDIIQSELIYKSLYVMVLFNSAISILLYCSGPLFRHQVCEFIHCSRRQWMTPSSQQTTPFHSEAKKSIFSGPASEDQPSMCKATTIIVH